MPLVWFGQVRDKFERFFSMCTDAFPGVTVYPDWFHPKIQEYWNKEFQLFYNPTTGVDIDGAWIDMNEPANASLSIPLPAYLLNSLSVL